jgi:hypothetical protein
MASNPHDSQNWIKKKLEKIPKNQVLEGKIS